MATQSDAATAIASNTDAGDGQAAATTSAPRVGFLDWATEIQPWLYRQGIPRTYRDLDVLCEDATGERTMEFCSCESFVTVGRPAQQVLLCEYAVEYEANLLVQHRLLLGIRAKRPQTIWSIPVAIGAFDPVTPKDQFRIQLRVELEPDGLALRVLEVPGWLGCANAGKYAVDFPERRAVQLREQGICRARGRYIWRGGTFRNTIRTPRGSSGP